MDNEEKKQALLLACLDAAELPAAVRDDEKDPLLHESIEKIRQDLVDVVSAGLFAGLSPVQIAAKVRDYLSFYDQYFDSGEMDRWFTSFTALHQLVDDICRQFGAHSKGWKTMRDNRVCAVCAKNEQQGAIPLTSTFVSGHRLPPAHQYCRCGVAYYGMSLDNAGSAPPSRP